MKSEKLQIKNENLPNGWRKVKLGEVAGVLGGFAFKSSWFNKQRVGCPVIKIQNLGEDGFIDTQNIEYIDIALIDKNISKFKVGYDDFFVAMTGATAGKIAVLKDKNKDYYLNQRVGKFYVKDKNKLDFKYLYYSTLTPRNKIILRQLADGSAQGNMSSSQIEELLEINLPSLDKQKRIAEILSAFDDKIEVNNKIIKTLEEMAQEVFKEWFVRFRFPGWEKVKFVNSELGKIPEGWEVKNIMEIIKRLPVGKRYDNRTALPKGKVPILDQGQSGIIGFHNEEPSVKANPQNPVAVFSNHTCYYRLVTFDFSCIQNVIPYIGINGYPTTFVFYLTKDKIKMSDYKGHWPEFANQKFVIPPPKLAIEYSEKIKPIVERVDEIRKENQTLAELRDLLLPKLMSGEIRV